MSRYEAEEATCSVCGDVKFMRGLVLECKGLNPSAVEESDHSRVLGFSGENE